MTHLSEGAIISANRELAPVPRDVKVEYRQTGYWHLNEKEEIDADLKRFIDAGPPPIYIGFGSMTDPSPGRTAAILQDLIDAGHYRLIVSKGWADLGVHGGNGNVRLVEYVPHAKLFPRMAAIVHHGGAGTIHTAAIAGVPQVVVPHVLDQYYWGSRIGTLGIGPYPISRRRLTSRNLLGAINTAVGDTTIRERACKMGERLRKVDGLRDAVDFLAPENLSWTRNL
jgi:UDP:flavonoid glycosyltransferase YjiC (YdhE family)